MTMRIVVTATLIMALAGTLSAGVMFGVVVDEEGNAVNGAKVAVWGKEGLEATTDAEGKFRITSDELVDGNRYSVTVNAEGFDQGQTMSVEIFADVDEMEPMEIELYKAQPLPEPEPAAEEAVMPGGQTGAVAAAEAPPVTGEEGAPPSDESMLIPNLDESEEGTDEPVSNATATESAPAME